MLKKIVFLNLLFWSSLGVSVPAAAQKILSISNLPIPIQASLLENFPGLQQAPVTLAELDNILRFLQLRPEFSHVRALDTNGEYQIEFSRTMRIASLKFVNNDSISNSETLQHFGVRTGEIFDQQGLIEGGEQLRKFYQSRGFLNAAIDIEMPQEGVDKIAIKVTVTENKQTLLKDIQIESENNELNQKLAKELSDYLNEPYTSENINDVQDTIRNYLREERYVRSEIHGPELKFSKDESELRVLFKIDKIEKYNFEFNGIRFLGIRDVERSLDLDNFQSTNPSLAIELAAKIRTYYLKKGYARVDVKVNEELGRKPHARKISFEITEGPLVKISSYEFTGSFSQSSEYYENFIKEHSSELISNDLFNKEDLELGVKNMILDLQNNGYLQAKLISTRTQYNKERTEVSVIINLEEGPLTVIQTIDFEGNNSYSKERILAISKLDTGPLRLGNLEHAVARIKEFYQEEGFIEMNLLNERQDLVRYNEENTRASLLFKISEGPQVRVASIILEGNTFTKDYILLKELDFQNGDLLTPSKVTESIARLQRTGFFGSVDIRTLEEKTSVSQRTVIVKVTERDPGLFSMGMGATNERWLTLRGYLGVGYRNLYGTGRGVSLRLEGNYNIADIKYLERRIILGYLEPYLFDTRIRGRVNLTRSQSVTDYSTRKVSEVNQVTYSFEKDFTSKVLGIWDVLSITTIADRRLDDRSQIDEKTIEIGSTGPTLDLDFRNNPFNPTAGSFTRWSAEYGSPYLIPQKTDFEVEYWKTLLSFTYYTPVGQYDKQPLVWANQIRGGYLKNMADTNKGGTPWAIKGFTLGGQTTVRGYESGTEEVFPNRADLKIGRNDDYNLLTDSTMYLIKSELRIPISGSIGAAVFYDGGSVQIKGLEFEESYRASVGGGLRYNTPVGPLSVDFAWKLNMRPGEEPWRFHLSIGSF